MTIRTRLEDGAIKLARKLDAYLALYGGHSTAPPDERLAKTEAALARVVFVAHQNQMRDAAHVQYIKVLEALVSRAIAEMPPTNTTRLRALLQEEFDAAQAAHKRGLDDVKDQAAVRRAIQPGSLKL